MYTVYRHGDLNGILGLFQKGFYLYIFHFVMPNSHCRCWPSRRIGVGSVNWVAKNLNKFHNDSMSRRTNHQYNTHRRPVHWAVWLLFCMASAVLLIRYYCFGSLQKINWWWWWWWLSKLAAMFQLHAHQSQPPLRSSSIPAAPLTFPFFPFLSPPFPLLLPQTGPLNSTKVWGEP